MGDGDEGSAGILGLKVSIAVAPESGNISGKSGNISGKSRKEKGKIGEYFRRKFKGKGKNREIFKEGREKE